MLRRNKKLKQMIIIALIGIATLTTTFIAAKNIFTKETIKYIDTVENGKQETIAKIRQSISENFKAKKVIEVAEVDCKGSYDLNKSVLFFWDKTQEVVVQGKATFYIDVSQINESCIQINDSISEIKLFLQAPQIKLENVEILPQEVDTPWFGNSDEITYTPSQRAKIEKEVTNNMIKVAYEENIQNAKDSTSQSIKEVLGLSGKNYNIVVQFTN